MKGKHAAAIVIGWVLCAGVAQAQPAPRARGMSGVIAGEPPSAVEPRAAAAPAAPLAANEERVGTALTIRGSAEFRAKVRADLETLRRTRTGASLLAALEQAGKPVTIAFGPQDGCLPLSEAAFAAGTTLSGRRILVDRPGAGSGSTLTVRRSDDACYPPAIVLGHELIHALHNAQGRNVKAHDYRAIDAGTDNHEEARTIGLGAYAHEPLTDNALRRELGTRALPERHSHSGECRQSR